MGFLLSCEENKATPQGDPRRCHLEILFLLLFVVRMIAGAVVFLIFAGRALFEVEIELLIDRLVASFGPDLDDGGKVVAFGDGLV